MDESPRPHHTQIQVSHNEKGKTKSKKEKWKKRFYGIAEFL